MELILPLMAFVFGICWGSFLNVWIYRIPLGRSVAGGRSACMSCKTTLSYLDLVPVFSFLFLGAKCRYCKVKLSWQYPMIELIVGLMFLGLYFRFDEPQYLLNPYIWLIGGFILTVNLVMARIDWNTTLIPNALSYPSIVIAAGLSFIMPNLLLDANVPVPTLAEAWIGGLGLFALFYLTHFLSNGGIGMGDAKWVLFMGLMLGYKYALMAVFMGTILSVIFSGVVILLFSKKIKELPQVTVSAKDEEDHPVEHKVWGVSIVNGKPAVVMGPFLAIGMILIWFFGVDILNWWMN